jgi:glycosyltransferase involved in cell wall biosynthesis
MDLCKRPDEIWFGMVGAITPLKGHDIFLETAERVLRQLPEAVFLIVGSNPYVTQAAFQYEGLLRRRVATSSLQDRVKFVGFRDDVPSVISQLDVLVQPNRGPEGLGRSVLEAMACGVPVITVDKWGPAELIEDGRSGLLFPPLDAEKLATHMLTLARSEPLRKAMGRHGCDWIQQNLVSKKLAGQFDGILASAIAPALQKATL